MDAKGKVPVGLGTIVGLVLTFGPLLGGVVQAIIGRDAPGLTVAAGGLLAGLVTVAGRHAQGLAAILRAGAKLAPMIDALQAALEAASEQVPEVKEPPSYSARKVVGRNEEAKGAMLSVGGD